MGDVIDIFEAQEQQILECEECDGCEFNAIRVGNNAPCLVCTMCGSRMIGIELHEK